MTNFESTLHARIDLNASLAKNEIRSMAQKAILYIHASIERYNRSAGQSRRQWNERRDRGKYG
jgi:hypothetical protein